MGVALIGAVAGLREDKMAWKGGDLVRLKSAGPVMTVQELTPPGVRCTWFDGCKLQHAIFAPETLVKGETPNVNFIIEGAPEAPKQE